MPTCGTTIEYSAHLAAVPLPQIARSRATRDARRIELWASRIEHCPHDLVGIEVFPLGALVAESIDIGQPLRPDCWHPLRSPIVVDPETVAVRSRHLDDVWRALEDELAGLMAEILGPEIDKLRRLYAHAGRRGEAIVSFLTPAGNFGELAGDEPGGPLAVRLLPGFEGTDLDSGVLVRGLP